MVDEAEQLKQVYDEIAISGDERTTACDFNLRDLEIAYGQEYIRDGDIVLDAGCGPGVAIRAYAKSRSIKAHAIDYSANMIALAKKLTSEQAPELKIDFQCASVMSLPFGDATFDVVTTHRCLMALLDWDLQQKALLEINRVLKPGGMYVMMEGTVDGLDRLNFFRRKFDLAEIEADGRDRLFTKKFDEKELLSFVHPHYELIRTQRFGMYYFITRIVHPLLAAPEAPKYDSRINEIAKQIAKVVPDFESIGHLVGFALRKRAT
ncbi:MAG: class I SAM-dependent methyltransferase [Hyphomicrobiaceae bacterium]